jgi:pyruvate/2-oxoglutarate dehydrogenase complex dihydrolipoamide dehydrogenase (E3) component
MAEAKPSWAQSTASPDDEPRDVAARRLEIWPLDAHNQRLLDIVRPIGWQDPTPLPLYDLVVIGAGAGGLVSAKQSARRGAKVAFISELLAGGDCLNAGCVPSKALLRCARALREARRAGEFGVRLPGGGAAHISIDFPAVMQRMRRLRAAIAPADSHDGTAASGAHVFQGRGRFSSPETVTVNGATLRFRKAIIATGGRAAVPPLPGLKEVPYLTNATLFNLTALPPRMAIIGAGPVGLEMAQAFSTFGAKVTVIDRAPRLLPRGDDRAAAALQAALIRDGVEFIFGAEISDVALVPETAAAVEAAAGTWGDAAAGEAAAFPNIRIQYSTKGGAAPKNSDPSAEAKNSDPGSLECEALLVATGRTPCTEDLGLEAAGVEHTPKQGVTVNSLLATSNPNVYAIGDCVAGAPRLTHMSGEMAKAAVQNALFGGDWALSYDHVPRCTYTEPEVASVGLDGESAAAKNVEVDVYETDLVHNDRVILEGDDTEGGFVRLWTARGSGTVLGGTVVSSRAGEIINEITLAMQAGLGIEALARVIHPYPTAGEGVMQAALGYVRKHWDTLG